mmetsp:Transcript_36537/g.80012  ORF Transcript_36537/g.80012 Transcript_36537/m.80012 type:complete len:337 (-) Transcript_36537:81-1091(-)
MVAPNDGASESSEVASLKADVAKLQQDMLMHRQVLEQFLEVRDGVVELLELREGVQATLQSAQVLHEVADRTAELDLSLAGVSDNTARHGRAISTLSEQQKRTVATLDAVVRAVKRLGRSRSRGAVPSTPRTAPGFGTEGRTSNGSGQRNCGNGGFTGSDEQCQDFAGVQQPEDVRCWQGMNTYDQDAEADPNWDWPEWPDWQREWGDRRPAPAEQDAPRCSSSGGAWPRRARHRPTNGIQRGEYDTPSAPASTEMAHCVQGVLARIEEALSKLDSAPRQQSAEEAWQKHAESGELCADRAPPAHAPKSWAIEPEGLFNGASAAPGSRPVTPGRLR